MWACPSLPGQTGPVSWRPLQPLLSPLPGPLLWPLVANSPAHLGSRVFSHTAPTGAGPLGCEDEKHRAPHQEKGKDEVAHSYLGTEAGWDVRGVTQMERSTPVQFI